MTARKSYDVLIAAGGFAQRYAHLGPHRSRPKSLVMGRMRPVVLSTAENVLQAGYNKLLVLNNRAEWHDALKHALAPIAEADVVQDAGYASTFLLVQEFVEQMDARFLFLYGHAPRPAEHLRKLNWVRSPIVASAFATSTKMKVIPRGNLFLEPPFLIERESIRASRARDWTTYFAEVENQLGVCISDGPAEPNTQKEFDNYLAHYESML